MKIGSFKFPAPQGPKLHLNSPLKRRILWSITPLSKGRCLNGKKKGMVYSLSVVNVILYILKFTRSYYQQVFGTAMGSPVSAVFANMVMEDVDKGL